MMISLFLAASMALTPQNLEQAFPAGEAAYVQITCSSGEVFVSDEANVEEKLPPCSTFKIWNSAIGLELGLVGDPDAPFWEWDGKKRTTVDAWNQDQTLRSAFATSCVPAYQELARKIGKERMKTWLEKIQYGDANISSGVDVFWLPEEGRQTLLISAREQAGRICRLVRGELPLSEPTRRILKEVMRVRTTETGTLYGKTGSGRISGKSDTSLGWFVGYVESRGKAHAFACWVKGPGLMGKDARASVEKLLEAQGLL